MPATTRMLRLCALMILSLGLVLGTSTQVGAASTAKAGDHKISKQVKKKQTLNKQVLRAAGVALGQRGDGYAYGAAGPGAFDCSGLIYYSFRKAGFSAMPRTSSAQAGHVRRIAKSNLHRGDLMFFANGGGVYHAGIFVGRTKGGAPLILHSSSPGRPVRIDVPWTSSWFAGTMRRS